MVVLNLVLAVTTVLLIVVVVQANKYKLLIIKVR